ncbi:MAG: LacI family DNA-binding transcriptional regulator [Clostridia bacterium]|nr:LacI family DNA-binding transcriptional regulator [Clostridia bacterium]
MPTIDDIVKISGVSKSTVNRFLAGQTVRGDNAKKIKNAMKELNYRPDKIVGKRNCTIEIIGPTGSTRLPGFQGYSEMMLGMINTLEKEGATVLIQPANTKYIPRADGIIIFGLVTSREDEIIETLKSRNIPFVMAYREIEKSGISYVTCDNYLAAYELTERLIKKGHKKIAVWGDSKQKRNTIPKIRGFRDCMAAHNLQVPSYLVFEEGGTETGERWMQRLLDDKIDFTAFFGLTDQAAITFMDYVQERGYKIPDDFAVVGMDGVATGFYTKPKLTTAAIPFREIGKKSAETIFELIDNPDTVSIRRYLKYEIEARESD